MAADNKALLRDAVKQVQSGKNEKAVELYKAAVKADPRDPTIHNSLGDLYAKMGKKKEAIAEYQEAAAIYEKQGFGMRAIAMVMKMVNLDPEALPSRIKLGELYAVEKKPAEAKAQYLVVANHHVKKNDTVAALDMFGRIANLDPDNIPERIKLAQMYEKNKLGAKAAEEYVRAAKGYIAKKEMDTAAQLYVRAFKLSPGNLEARRRLAEFYAQRQDWPVVVGLLEGPALKGVADTELTLLYAEAITRVNHPRDAVKVLEPLQGREPNSLPVNLALGRAYIKAGDLEKGNAAFSRCVSAHLAENRLEAAEFLLREMSAAAPDDEKILLRLLEVSQKRGEKESIGRVHLQLAAAYEKKGIVASAVDSLEKYLESCPDDAAAKRLDGLRSQLPAAKSEAPPPVAPPQPAKEPPAKPAPAPLKPAAPPVKPEPKPQPPESADDELFEIHLDDDEVDVVDVPEEVELSGAGNAAAAIVLEPASVADARTLMAQGASGQAASFLEEHLGGNPRDVDAWEALVEARRLMGDNGGVHDAYLRLADLHRRSGRFAEARNAYSGALGVNPRSPAARRGMVDIIQEEDDALAAAAAPPAAAPGLEEGVPAMELDLMPELEQAPELEPELELAPEPEPEPALAQAPELVEPEPAPAPELPEELSLESEFAPEPEAGPAAAQPNDLSVEIPDEGVAQPAGEVFEIPLDDAGGQFWGLEESAAPPEATPLPAPEPPQTDGLQIEEFSFEGLDDSVFDASVSPVEKTPAAAPTAPAAARGDAPTAESGGAEFDEFLAEADFYFQQGLVDEAEFLYKKLLNVAPGHPVVAAQLTRIEQMRAPAAGDAGGGASDSFDQELNLAFGDAPAVEPEPEPQMEPEPETAERMGAPEALPGLEPESEAAPPETVSPGAAQPEADAEFGFTDFLSEMRQELQIPSDLEEMPAPAPQSEDGLTEIFQEFQRSVKQQLGDEDFETHYNLGIAYKEMGLMTEAVAEFELAEKSPERRLNAVSMIALCLRELGRYDEAALKLRTGITLATEGSEDQKGFLYDLAALDEQAGRVAESQESLRRLLAIDPGYRDVAAKVAPLPAQGGLPPRKKPKVSYL